MAFPIVALGSDGKTRASGTAVAVAQNILLTARHVIEDFIGAFGARQTTGPLALEIDFEILVHQITSIGELVWRVVQIWYSSITDAAVLLVQPFSSLATTHIWRLPPLRLLPPPVGARVVGFGFHSSAARRSDNEIEWKVETASTTGIVTQVHHERRDQRLNFPCFETTARVDGGMSGGPFFSYRDPSDIEKGMELCGLACSSFPPFDDGQSVSWVASLWPVVATLITAPRADSSGEGSYALFDLVRNIAGDADKVSIEKLSETQVTVSASYTK